MPTNQHKMQATDNGGSRPVPDPTVLTTAALASQIGNLRELLESRIGAVQHEIEARLTGMDRAVDLLAKGMSTLPIERLQAIGHLQELTTTELKVVETRFDLYATKFDGVQTQFEERDKRTEQLSLASSTAIAAALQAQKESAVAQNESNAASIAKSEAGFAKQIDQIDKLVQSMKAAIDGSINDIKERLTRMEGKSGGVRDVVGWIFGAAMLLIAAASFFIPHLK